jgi:hypothetical protein
MLAVRLCAPRVIARLASIGITSLGDLAHREPDDLSHEVNVHAGRPMGAHRSQPERWPTSSRQPQPDLPELWPYIATPP